MLMLMLTLGCTTETSTSVDTPTVATPVEAAPAEAVMYVCPMHPDITSGKEGSCSKCGMDLVKQEAHDHGSHEHGEEAKTPVDEHHGH